MGPEYPRRFQKERKFHSPFSSYSSNPNPFPPPPQQPQQQPQQQPMFSSRRQEDPQATAWYPRRGSGYHSRAPTGDRPRNVSFNSYNSNKRYSSYDYRRTSSSSDQRYPSSNGPRYQPTQSRSERHVSNGGAGYGNFNNNNNNSYHNINNNNNVSASTHYNKYNESRSNSTPVKSEEEIPKYDYTDYNNSLEDYSPTVKMEASIKEVQKNAPDITTQVQLQEDVDMDKPTEVELNDSIQKDGKVEIEVDVEQQNSVPNIDIQKHEKNHEDEKENKEENVEEENGTIDTIMTDSNTEKELDVEMDKSIDEPMEEENNIKIEQESSNIVQPLEIKNETNIKIDYSQVQADIFPMREPELKAWELKHQPLVNKSLWLKHLNTNTINDFSQYSFLDTNLLIFKQADAFSLFKFFSTLDKSVDKKISNLTNEWAYRSKLWHSDLQFYDKQIQEFYQTNDSKKEEEKKLDDDKPKGGRRNRHGDSVRTEAEFMEILKTLEQERERDPLVRAQYGAATIPDMILNPIEKIQFNSFIDLNNLEINKTRWAQRVLTDPIDNFTDAEHEKFVQAYLMYPKRFGKISQQMGGVRTSEDCVLHYYRTKKDANYKQLIINKNKKNKKAKSLTKKPKKLIKGSKGSNSASEIENGGTPLEDISGEFFLESRKRKTGITVPIKKSATSESILNDDTPEPETPIEHDESRNDFDNDAIIPDAAIAIAIATQSVQEPSLQVPQPQPQKEPQSPLLIQPTAQPIIVNNEINGLHEEKKRKKRRTEEGHSSYWSVQEINKFPMLLQQFGSDWDEISKVLKTKTAAMARNYYQRSLNDHPHWKSFVITGDANKASNTIFKEIETPTVVDGGDSIQPVTTSGPPVGLFYKKPSSYTSSLNAAPVPATQQQTSPTPSIVNTKEKQLAPPPHFIHSTPLVEVKAELNEISKLPIRASIRSLLNSDDCSSTTTSTTATVLAVKNPLSPQQQSPVNEIKSLAPPPILTNMNSTGGFSNLVNGNNNATGINGLAAVAGLYANSPTSPEVVKEEFKSIMSQNQSKPQPNVKQNNMSALNALAKVAFEQN